MDSSERRQVLQRVWRKATTWYVRNAADVSKSTRPLIKSRRRQLLFDRPVAQRHVNVSSG